MQYLAPFDVQIISNQLGYILEWAGHENADFRATDSGSAVSNVVLRIVGQSVARAALGD